MSKKCLGLGQQRGLLPEGGDIGTEVSFPGRTRSYGVMREKVGNQPVTWGGRSGP